MDHLSCSSSSAGESRGLIVIGETVVTIHKETEQKVWQNNYCSTAL